MCLNREIVLLSRRYGADPDWALSGGGDCSWKDGQALYVKASGVPLDAVDENGFCEMDLGKLAALWSLALPEDPKEREAAVLAGLLSARAGGEEKRPSADSLIHAVFPGAFVISLQPAIMNGLACAKDGRQAFLRLFGDEAVWVPYVDPGHGLARAVKSAFEAFTAERGFSPRFMFMQNRGFLASGATSEEVDTITFSVKRSLEAELSREPDFSAAQVEPETVERAQRAVRELCGENSSLAFRTDAEILRLASSGVSFAAIGSAFTPDHIVHSGHEYLYSGPGDEEIGQAWNGYVERNGARPKICVVRGAGAFALGPTVGAAETAMDFFSNACRIAVYAESFGGASHMRKESIDFIRDREAGKRRSPLTPS